MMFLYTLPTGKLFNKAETPTFTPLLLTAFAVVLLKKYNLCHLEYYLHRRCLVADLSRID